MTSADLTAGEPERALAGIPGLAGGRIVEQLADGPTNSSYLVERSGRLHVMRLDKPEAAALGLDRENEYRVVAAAAAAGLAPGYSHVDRAAGVSLRPFVPGRSLTPDDLAEPRTLANLAGVLGRLHRLTPLGRAFDPLGAARRYADQLGGAEPRRLARRAESVLSCTNAPPAAPALCHNDLVSGNVLRTEAGELLLIDWEYAGVGDPYFDLSVVVRHHGIAKDLTEHFLQAYLQREPSGTERRHLERQCDFYGCLLALWKLRISM